VAVLCDTLASLDMKSTTPAEPLADGMGLGMELMELDGRRGRSIRLASEMGLANNDRTKTEAQYRQGLERCSGA